MSEGQARFWDVQDRLRELSAQGDPMEKLAATVDFEIFRAKLAATQGRATVRRADGPPSIPS